MSWQQAKDAAAEWAKTAGFTGELSGKKLLLPNFETEAHCRFFLPDRCLAFHVMMIQAATRTARKAGAKIVPVFVEPKDYRAWLRAEDLEDAPERREYYIRSQTMVV